MGPEAREVQDPEGDNEQAAENNCAEAPFPQYSVPEEKQPSQMYNPLLSLMNTPFALKPCGFILALVLIVFSILGLGEVFGEVDPRKLLNHTYGILLGFVIIVCDSKSRWNDAWYDVQFKLFHWCYFLQTVHGRSLFYMYVGCMIILVLPESEHETWLYIAWLLSGAFILLGLACISMYWCCWKNIIMAQGYRTSMKPAPAVIGTPHHDRFLAGVYGNQNNQFATGQGQVNHVGMLLHQHGSAETSQQQNDLVPMVSNRPPDEVPMR